MVNTSIIPNFLEDGNYIWVSEFDENALRAFYMKFCSMEEDPSIQVIPIVISSYGGDVASMIAMRDLIKSCAKPVATIAIGKAMSAGCALLAAGHKGLRYAGKDTLLMVHEVSSGAEGKTADLLSKVQSTEYLNDLMFKNLSDDTGTPKMNILKNLHDRKNADWYFSSATAKKVGIIDHIGVPRVTQNSPLNGLRIFEKAKRGSV